MADTEARQVMREQATYHQIKIDPLWSDEELAQKIIDAQLAAEAKAVEEFTKAKKIKVRMVRDGWPLSGTRVRAGQTCDIPIPLAQRWLETGACVRADPLPGIE
jgi:hypothetical protein